MAIVRYSDGEIRKMIRAGKDGTDWKRLRKTRDEEIDYSDIPRTTAGMMARAYRPGRPKKENAKRVVSMRWEPEVLDALKKLGPNWTTKPNEIVKGWLIGAGQL